VTTHLHRGDHFLGYPVTKLKAFLGHCFDESGFHHPVYLSALSTLDLSEGTCAAFLHECQDRGFFEMRVPDRNAGEGNENDELKTLHLSRRGMAVAVASARKRTTKDKAKAILDSIVSNATKVSNDTFAPIQIETIWVFGSFIDDEKPDVGDLDIVVTHRWSDKWIDPFKLRKYVDKHYPGLLPYHLDPFHVEVTWVARMIYGKRRNALISESRIRDLIALHCPCRLVFDAKRGGPIPPEDFPFHPKSERRADTIQPRLEMPPLDDIEPDFMPTAASVVVCDRNQWFDIYEKPEQIIESLVPFAAGVNVDGRFGFLVGMMAGSSPAACFVIERRVEYGDLEWRYIVDITATHVRKSYYIGYGNEWTLGRALGTLLVADMIRLADRRSRLSRFPTIVSDVRLCSRCLRLTDFASELRSIVFGKREHTVRPTMPPRFQFGIGFLWAGVEEWVHLPPFEWEDNDWCRSTIDRDDYEQWVRTVKPTESLTG
jgi:predicted nucleotidyltransferase